MNTENQEQVIIVGTPSHHYSALCSCPDCQKQRNGAGNNWWDVPKQSDGENTFAFDVNPSSFISELREISAAIGTSVYMDPPDGGSVSLAEQVRRMRVERDELSTSLEILTHENKSMASVLTEINEYCQMNNIGKIGDSAGLALITHCNHLAATVEALQGGIREIMINIGAGATMSEVCEMVYIMESGFSATPQQHLRDARAEAIESALDYMYSNTSPGNSASDDFDLIRDYAARVKAGEV